jgi:hypothetical protein
MKEQVLLSYKKGITRTPSDLLCEDGDLAECVNLEVRNEELVPMEMPVDMGVTLASGEELVHVHNISQVGRKNYIIKSGNTIKAFYLNGTNRNDYSLNVSVSGFKNCVHLGNTLVLYGENGATYVLFKELQYTVLGNELPDVSLSFNLTGEYKLEAESYEIDETGENNSPYSITGSTDIHKGHVNKFISEQASGQGKFMYPFFVRYALRLYNGEYVRYSAPVLMLPSIYTSPSIYLLNTTLSGGLKSAEFVVGGYVADLQMKVNNTDDLSNWSDIVKGVSIFITRETPSYDQNYEDSDNFLSESNTTGSDNTINSISCEHIGEITSADKLEGHTVVVNSLPVGYIKWNSKNIYGMFGTQMLSVPTFSKDALVGDLIANSAVYYKYVDIDANDLLVMPNEYKILSNEYNVYPIDTIEQSEKLDLMGDYMTNDVLVPSFANVYNSRINMANIKRFLYEGYKPDSLSQQLSGSSDYEVYTYIHSEGGNDIVVKSGSLYQFGMYGAYLYYPDTDAYKMVIVDKTGRKHVEVQLAEDMYSNGSYYINLDGLTWVNGVPSISATSVNYEFLPNKLFTSDVNNPYYFPLEGINTVGTGTILGISALTRPISQGQFGEYPLMAFCTDGNFGLRVDEQGYYSGISPMQEDIILGQDKLTPLENSILAITKKGIMITGATSDMAQIALQMEGKNFDFSVLPEFTSGATFIASIATASVDSEGFRDYLEKARMAYDYSSDRIIIYSRGKKFSYVYNFSTATVGKLVIDNGDGIVTHVLDYPDSIVQTTSGKLYSLYGKEDINELNAQRMGFAITRPLKCGHALSLKTIMQVKNLWAKVSGASSVQYKIYGSNDNITYYQLKSRFGKPYKYYRMALFVNMLPKESISGTVLVIEERRTNKLR